MSFPLQTSVPLYQSKTTAGQDMTGPGQARVANGGVFATVGATDKQLFGRVAAYSGSYNEYAIFPNATTTAGALQISFTMINCIKTKVPIVCTVTRPVFKTLTRSPSENVGSEPYCEGGF